MLKENIHSQIEGNTPKVVRVALQVMDGAIPFAGRLFSALNLCHYDH